MSYSLETDRKSSSKLSPSLSSPPTSSSSPSSGSEHEGQMEESDPVASNTSGVVVGHQEETRRLETTRGDNGSSSFEENCLQHQPSLSPPSSSSSSSLSSTYSLSSTTSSSSNQQQQTTHKQQQQQLSSTTCGIIKCSTCGKTFNNSSALAKHKLIHSDERKYTCQLCRKSFKRQDHLNGHLNTHAEKKPYQCQFDNCDNSYCDSRSLRRHYENHHQLHHQLQHQQQQQQQQFQRQKNVSMPPFLSDSVVMTPGLTPRSAGLVADGVEGTPGGTVFTFENVDPRHFGQTEGSIDGGLSTSVPPSPSLSLNPLQMSPISPAITPLLELLNEHKPVACEMCEKRFKNMPALNGHMRLHGGYSKKATSAEKGKSSVAGQQQQNQQHQQQQHLQQQQNQQNQQHSQQTPSPRQAAVPASRARSPQRRSDSSPPPSGFGRSTVDDRSPALGFHAKEEAMENSPCGVLESPCGILESPCGILESPHGIHESPLGIHDSPRGIRERTDSKMEVKMSDEMVMMNVDVCDRVIGNSSSGPRASTEVKPWGISCPVPPPAPPPHSISEIGIVVDSGNSFLRQQELASAGLTPEKILEACELDDGEITDDQIIQLLQELDDSRPQDAVISRSSSHINSFNNIDFQGAQSTDLFRTVGLPPGDPLAQTAVGLQRFVDHPVVPCDASCNLVSVVLPQSSHQVLPSSLEKVLLKLPSPAVRVPRGGLNDTVKYIPLEIIDVESSALCSGDPSASLTPASGNFFQGASVKEEPATPSFVFQQKCTLSDRHQLDESFFDFPVAQQNMPVAAAAAELPDQVFPLSQNNNFINQETYNKILLAFNQKRDAFVGRPSPGPTDGRGLQQQSLSSVQLIDGSGAVLPHRACLVGSRDVDNDRVVTVSQKIQARSSFPAPFSGSSGGSDELLKLCDRWQANKEIEAYLKKLKAEEEENRRSAATSSEGRQQLSFRDLVGSSSLDPESSRPVMTREVNDGSCIQLARVDTGAFSSLSNIVQSNDEVKVQAGRFYTGSVVAPSTDRTPVVILVSQEDLMKNPGFINKPIQLIFSQDGSISSFTTGPCLPMGVSDRDGRILSNPQQFLVDVQECGDRPATKKKIKPQPLTIPYSANNYHSQAGTSIGGGGGIKRPPSPQKAVPARRLKSSNSPVFTPTLPNPSSQVFQEFTRFVGLPPQSAPPHNKDFTQYTFEDSKDFDDDDLRGFPSEGGGL